MVEPLSGTGQGGKGREYQRWLRPEGGRIARRGQWVQIYVKVLDAGQRAPNVPPETQAVPLEMVVKGFLQEDQVGLGEPATVRTLSDRVLQGVLVAVEPRYGHDFGAPVAELLQVGPRVRRLLAGGENHAR